MRFLRPDITASTWALPCGWASVLVASAILGLLCSTVGDKWAWPLAGLGALGLVIAAATKPAAAAYIWLALCPLIVGVARGDLLFLRPNEALLLILLLGLALFGLKSILFREGALPSLNAVDLSLLSLTLFGSLLPLLLRYGRGLSLTGDDVLYAVVFCKYLVLYALFRLCIRSARQVKTCLRLALVSGAIVAIVALLQVRGLFSVPDLLSRYYDSPFEGSSGATTLRGSSTIASSFGLADTMAILLALSIAQINQEGRFKPLMLIGAFLFLAGSVAAGSFSGLIGCAVAIAVVGWVTNRGKLMIAFSVPASLVAALVFWPVIAARIAGFETRQALPKSWIGRLENLERFFWPELFSGANWIWGVRPAARVPAPETWRTWVYIESGHTWLLWVGGTPLLLAFFVFAFTVARRSFRSARLRTGPVAVAAAGALAAMAMIFTLMLFDPHLTVRGTADLFFPLLALSLVQNRRVGTTKEGGTGARNCEARAALTELEPALPLAADPSR